MSTLTLGQNDPSEEVLALRSQLSSKDTQTASYQTQLMKKSNELDELKKTFEEAIHKLSHETQRALELEERLRQRDHDLTNEKLARQNMESAFSNATKDNKNTDLEVRNLQSILEAISQESRAKDERLEQLEKEKSTLQERVRELQFQVPLSPVDKPVKRPTHRPRSSSLSNFRVTTLEQELREARTSLHQREKELKALSEKFSATRGDALRAGNEKLALERTLSAKIRDLEGLLEEQGAELQRLSEEDGGSGREQELLERIDEDEAKIAALEEMLQDTSELTSLRKKLRSTESQLQEERHNIQRITQLHSRLKEEKENLVRELRVAQASLETRNQGMHGDDMTEDCTGIASTGSTLSAGDLIANSDAAEYVGRLLAAVDRLRGERDNLQRDVQFLESESRFAIEALEAKLSASQITSSSTGNTVGSLAQMKSEMDALHIELCELKLEAESEINLKDCEIRRLNQVVTVLGITVDHISAMDHYHGEDEVATAEATVKDLEGRLDVTMLCLEATTSQRDDLVETLKNKEESWANELEAIKFGQQQATRTIQDLANQVDDLTNQLDAAESERNTLAVQVQNIGEDLEDARVQLTKAESRYSDLQFHQLNSMSSNEATMTLRNQIQELEMRVLRRNEQVGIHQHDIRRLETNLRLQEDRLSEMTMEMEMLNAQKDAMVEDCASTREERDAARHRVDDIEEEMLALEATQARDQETIDTMIHVVVETIAKARAAMQEQGRALSATHEVSMQRALSLTEELRSEKARMDENISAHLKSIDELKAEVKALKASQDDESAIISNLEDDLHHQSERHLAEIEHYRALKEEMEKAHADATDGLLSEVARLQTQLNEREMSSTKEGEPNGDLDELKARCAVLKAELIEQEAQFKAEQERVGNQLSEALRAKESLRAQHEQLQIQLSTSEERYSAEVKELQQQIKQDADSLNQVSLQQEAWKHAQGQLQAELDVAKQNLSKAQADFEQQLQDRDQELERVSIRVQELSSQILEEQDLRLREQQETQAALQEANEKVQRKEGATRLLEDHVSRLEREIADVKGLHLSSEQDRTQLQQSNTNLLAKVEQNKSVQRVLENQVQEREKTIFTLRSELSRVQAELARIEQTNAKASLSMSMMSAQHKREMSELQRELHALRTKSNLDHVIAELEERNKEMDELLKAKCAEIEQNDDRALEMLKENKKLSSKVESLTRKVQTLQTKVANMKTSPKQGSAPLTLFSAPSAAEPTIPEPNFQRPRSITTSASQPTFSVPSAGPSNGPKSISRVASLHVRPKTPEKRWSATPAPVPVFKSRTPERQEQVPEPVSIIGKKRRAPDDFEVCETMPPQVFTAESIPSGDGENRTPRVRRVLSSLQSGFTPARNAARPVMTMPSPRRSVFSAAQSSPHISDVTNSPLVVPPANPNPQSAKSKRSWLGKIRGASTSSSNSSLTQGVSRHQ
ncbi:hypothetical protein FA15DRAFT_759700 [Coprinopsis marcescibilis]|uniref:Uncharacterized protein n=1 Tax=Coprinopsis marcescibilis TaxID=230819 RepID=A0A5C3KIU8_COPMA|nr:hypothetical protein FA15DRAFT_759700 [Coprinopsis marcescibilis]